MLKRIIAEVIRFPVTIIWHLMGWRITRESLDIDKVVLTGAPHTSNWDYMHYLFAAIVLRRKIYVTIKSELFFPPLGWILRALGGIPIDRHSSNNLVEQLVERLNAQDRMLLLFTPDGTRSYQPYWKTGFYWVAKEAGVPILLGIPDYKQKIAYLDYVLIPSGDIEADFAKIREQQEKYGVALYPEKANPVITRQAYEASLMASEESITADGLTDAIIQETEFSA
ncbi:MAG: 1-acyl-sn-glycerol-3-phosphate acyltransferase [Anaerolineae bacterium]